MQTVTVNAVLRIHFAVEKWEMFKIVNPEHDDMIVLYGDYLV